MKTKPFPAACPNKPSRIILFFLLLMIFLLHDSQKALAELPFLIPAQEQLLRLQTAQIDTNKGSIFIELYPEAAPLHVANLKYRADKGLFRNTVFNKFSPGYVIQGGIQRGQKTHRGYSLSAEFNSYPQQRGSIGMARVEDLVNPERLSDASQIYILMMDAPHMNGKYTSFGKIIQGFEVLDKLRQGDLIKDIRVFVR